MNAQIKVNPNAMVTQSPRRILHIITGLETGGAEMMLLKLLENINRQRFDCSVLSLSGYGPLADRICALGIPVHALSLNPKAVFQKNPIWELICLIKHGQPDLIQGWMYHGNLVALIAQYLNLGLHFRKIPVIWNIRHSVPDLEYEKPSTARIIKLLGQCSGLSDTVIYNSKVSVGQHEALGYQAQKTCVISNGFDINLFQPSVAARHHLRQELGLRDSDIIIGLIARYHPMKDHFNFLKAATILMKARPDTHFVLVGSHVNHHNAAIVEIFTKLRLTERVNNIHLLGERQDMPAVTAGLDIASLSSAWGDAFPNVLGEAMACGIPCVTTDVGDAARIVGDTGKVVPTRQPQHLVNAWQSLLDLTPEHRLQLGLRARERIVSQFSLPTIVAQYEQLYERTLTL